MNEDMRERLHDFVLGRLDSATAERLEAELLESDEMRKELESIRAYHQSMKGLEEAEIPAGFLEGIRAKIEKPPIWKRVLHTLFFPLGTKIPLEVGGVVVTVVLILLIYNPFQTEKLQETLNEVRLEEQALAPAEPKREPPKISAKYKASPSKKRAKTGLRRGGTKGDLSTVEIDALLSQIDLTGESRMEGAARKSEAADMPEPKRLPKKSMLFARSRSTVRAKELPKADLGLAQAGGLKRESPKPGTESPSAAPLRQESEGFAEEKRDGAIVSDAEVAFRKKDALSATKSQAKSAAPEAEADEFENMSEGSGRDYVAEPELRKAGKQRSSKRKSFLSMREPQSEEMHPGRKPLALKRAVKHKLPQLKRLYNQHMQKGKQFEGAIYVKIAVKPNGKVDDVTIRKSSTDNPEFDKAVLAEIRTWRFPVVPKDQGVFHLYYPLQFSQPK